MRYQVTFETQQPVVLADGPQAGNLIESLGYIPGSAVWGAFAARAAGVLQMDQQEQRKRFDHAFNGGVLRFSNLFPAAIEFARYSDAVVLRPSRLVPRSALTCKAVPGFRSDRISPLRGLALCHGVWDEVEGDQATCESCGAHTDRAAMEFYTVNDVGGLSSFAPVRSYRVHNEIDDAQGRTEQGKLFAVRGLERRQFFIGSIEVDDAAPPQGGTWSELLPAPGTSSLFVFGKRRGSYGGGYLRLEQDEAPRRDLWGHPLDERVQRTDGGGFNITFESDAIVVDEWLQYRSDLEPLRRKWEAELKQPVKSTGIWLATRTYAGWNGVDGCPRETELAVAAGSVFAFQVPGANPGELSALLTRIETDGIGLRRNEGFGKVIVNDSFHTLAAVAAGTRAR